MEQVASIMEIERRYTTVEFRVADEDGDDTGVIVGYPAVFNQRSLDLGGFHETVRKGAFAKTIQEADIRALFNHDPNLVLGRNRAGTLTLEEDAHGLKATIKPPKTQWAEDLKSSIKRGDIDQMSFGFQTIKDEWEGNERELVEIKLFDVSPVTFGAYPQTSVEARNHVAQLKDKNKQSQEDEPGKDSHSSEDEPGQTQAHEARVRMLRLLKLQ